MRTLLSVMREDNSHVLKSCLIHSFTQGLILTVKSSCLSHVYTVGQTAKLSVRLQTTIESARE